MCWVKVASCTPAARAGARRLLRQASNSVLAVCAQVGAFSSRQRKARRAGVAAVVFMLKKASLVAQLDYLRDENRRLAGGEEVGDLHVKASKLKGVTVPAAPIDSAHRLLTALLNLSKLEAGGVRTNVTKLSLGGLFDELQLFDVALGHGLVGSQGLHHAHDAGQRALEVVTGDVLDLFANAGVFEHGVVVGLQLQAVAFGLDGEAGLDPEHQVRLLASVIEVDIVRVGDLGLDPAKVNLDGGALALGHPLGATGARITGKAASLLQRTDVRYAIATLCIAGGQGVATLLEAV